MVARMVIATIAVFRRLLQSSDYFFVTPSRTGNFYRRELFAWSEKTSFPNFQIKISVVPLNESCP